MTETSVEIRALNLWLLDARTAMVTLEDKIRNVEAEARAAQEANAELLAKLEELRATNADQRERLRALELELAEPCSRCGGDGCPWCADTGREPPVP